MNTRLMLVWLALALLLAGCSSLLPPASRSATPLGPKEVPPESAPSTPLPGPPIEVTEVNPSLPIPSLPGLEALVEKARRDLAQKRSIAEDAISVTEAREVMWPDSSLGCPQPGMAYSQVVTRGYMIRLETGGRLYEYHAGLHGDPFLCENPTAPLEGTPGGASQ